MLPNLPFDIEIFKQNLKNLHIKPIAPESFFIFYFLYFMFHKKKRFRFKEINVFTRILFLGVLIN